MAHPHPRPRLHVGGVRHPRTGLLLRLPQRARTRERRERRRGPGRGRGSLVTRRLRLCLGLRWRWRRGLRRCPGEPFLQLRARRTGRRRRRVRARVRREMQLAINVDDIVGGEEGRHHLLRLGLGRAE